MSTQSNVVSPWGTIPSTGLFGPWKEPAFVIIYGPTKAGKTCDAIWAFPHSAIYFCVHSDGLKGAVKIVGWQLRPDQIRQTFTLSQAYGMLQQMAQDNDTRRQAGDFPAYLCLVIDDLSLMVDNEMAAMKQLDKYKVGGGYDWTIWTDLMALILAFGNLARYAGIHVIANAHVRGPDIDSKGKHHRGGPHLPSLKQVKRLPTIASSVLKIESDVTQPMWPAVFRCEPDPSFIMGDRHGLRGKAPMNLGEWMRSNDYVIPRPPELTWMEEWVETIADRLDSGRDRAELVQKAKETLLAKGHTPQHVYWVIRDGVHRHAFRKINANNLLGWV